MRPALAVCTVVLGLLALARTAEAACRIADPGTTRAVTLGPDRRTAQVHIPTGFDPSRPAPLVLVLHGSNGTGSGILDHSGLAATSDRHGFIVVAPDGGIPVQRGFVWNVPGVPTVTGAVPGPDDADDVAFLLAAIDELADQGCVDPTRVYATGLSGGGRMTSWLGCVAADRFAAIAPVVGLRAGNPRAGNPDRPDPATCRPSRPMPVIAFAGDADTTNPIQGGGAPYWSYTMHAAEQRWARLNGCAGPRATVWITPAVYEEGYGGCRDDAEVIGRITTGGAHQWVADNDAMWAFFAGRSRGRP